MGINEIIMCFMAAGAAIGGIDRILGNKFGYGEKFENGFRMLGPVGLSMAGIICMAPVLSSVLGRIVGPISKAIHMDPGIWGSVLSVDMGGYLMATELAEQTLLGVYSGIIVACVFGCTIVYAIPVGLAAIREEDRPYFTKGILLGFTVMPAAIVLGGLMIGLSIGTILWNSLPVLLIALFLAIGVIKWPEPTIKGFRVFAKLIQIVSTIGLTLAAIQHMTGFAIVKGMPALLDAMRTVCSIGIIMLGSMPLAELFQRILRKPLEWIRKKTGLSGIATTALLLSFVSAAPALAMIPDMEKRGKIVSAAFVVFSTGAFGAHLAFTINAEPEVLPAMLATKLVGGALAIAVSMAFTRNLKQPE